MITRREAVFSNLGSYSPISAFNSCFGEFSAGERKATLLAYGLIFSFGLDKVSEVLALMFLADGYLCFIYSNNDCAETFCSLGVLDCMVLTLSSAYFTLTFGILIWQMVLVLPSLCFFFLMILVYLVFVSTW